MSALSWDDFLHEQDERRERAEELERQRRLVSLAGPLDPYCLTPPERRSYRTGKWLGTPVPSRKIAHAVTDAQAAAELAARVSLMLEERG